MKALRAIMPSGLRWRPLAAELGVLRTFSISEQGVGVTLTLSSSIGESHWAPGRRLQSLLYRVGVGRPTPAGPVHSGLLVSGQRVASRHGRRSCRAGLAFKSC
jgi:hypothetical protein